MKKTGIKLLSLILAAVLLSTGLAGCAKPAASATDTQTEETAEPQATEAAVTPALPSKDVVILFTNDVHCGVEGNIGYAGVSFLKQQLVEEGNEVLLVDCGDAIQGDLIGQMSSGENIVTLMNRVGYDLAIPGNHEFDYHASNFFALTELAEYPYLCCNLLDNKTGELALKPYEVITIGGVKIGFVGILTPETATSTRPTNYLDEDGQQMVDFSRDTDGTLLYSRVQSAVDAARAEGADYIVALAHLGISASSSPWTSTEVVENTSGIDVFLDGHSHSTFNGELVTNLLGNPVLMSQTGTKLAKLGKLTLSTDGKWTSELLDSVDGTDEAITATIAEMTAEYQEEMEQVVAHTDFMLTIQQPDTDPPVRIVRQAETNLGDLVADAFRSYAGADIGLINGGGVRVTVPAGDISIGLLHQVQPFGNLVQVIELTGQQLLDMLEWGVRDLPEECGSFCQVSGMSYEIDTRIPSHATADVDGNFNGIDGEYRVKNVMVGGEPLQLDKTYTCASINYIVSEYGDGRTMLNGCKIVLDEGLTDFEVLLQYITETLGGEITEEYSNPFGQERITAIQD